MFSFVGDTVLDPFAGTGTTTLAASRLARNSISIELDREYFEYLARRVRNSNALLTKALFVAHESTDAGKRLPEVFIDGTVRRTETQSA